MSVPKLSREDRLSRFKGAMLGLAAGDALGTSVEFSPPGTFHPLIDIVGGGPFNLVAGQWTDDTSMALCLGQSLIDSDGFDGGDQIEAYVRWYRDGYMSSNGVCFDIGNTVRAALHVWEGYSKTPYCGKTDPQTAGNGSLMRLAPIPLAFADDPAEAIDMAALSSRTTHGAPVAVDACRYMAALIVGAIQGASKYDLCSDHFVPAGLPADYWQSNPLAPEIAAIATGSYKGMAPPVIRGTGYAAHALEAALWAFQTTSNFRDGCLRAANLGDDADTTAAIYGQLAGAFYGDENIPQSWRDKLALREKIETLAANLLALCER
ncbi:MAG: ADP-ribosylglycohydrolase family protein [Cyanobacteria bacterium REEB67]|nr:ADP-ribosylglycohydrolase family protein [Cyanobacteria bacterium REEB67]